MYEQCINRETKENNNSSIMSLIATFDISLSEEEDNTSTTTPNDRDGRPKLRHSLYLGGKAAAKDYDTLVHRWKITHIVNMTPPKQTNIDAGVPNYFEKAASHPRIRYLRIPIYDTALGVRELVTEHYEQHIVHFITKGLCHGNVLVHCARGVSRSTMAVLLYLMTKRNMRYDAALALIRRRRPQAQPIPAFETFLQQRDAQLFGARTTTAQDEEEGEGGGVRRSSNTAGVVVGTTTTTTSYQNHKKRPRRTLETEQQQSPSLAAVTIGPTLPPSLAAAVTAARSTTAVSTTIINPSTKKPKIRTAPLGPATVVRGIIVGPELPPSSTSSLSSRHHGTTMVAPTTESIGPVRPPPSSSSASQSIGPALPPGLLE